MVRDLSVDSRRPALSMLAEFRKRMLALHDKNFKRWKGLVVENIVMNIWPHMRRQGEPNLRRAGMSC